MTDNTTMTDTMLALLSQQLLDQPYMVIDILPQQVPANSAGQYAKAEKYWEIPKHLSRIHRRFAEIILKLNCYFNIAAAFCTETDEWSSWKINPDPEQLVSLFVNDYKVGNILILLPDERVLIYADRQDTYMTVFNPSGKALDLIQALTASEGLFLRKPE